jgi:hypothetical protein
MGRLALIVQFQWFRIATISSHEHYYAQVNSMSWQGIIWHCIWPYKLLPILIINSKNFEDNLTIGHSGICMQSTPHTSINDHNNCYYHGIIIIDSPNLEHADGREFYLAFNWICSRSTRKHRSVEDTINDLLSSVTRLSAQWHKTERYQHHFWILWSRNCQMYSLQSELHAS